MTGSRLIPCFSLKIESKAIYAPIRRTCIFVREGQAEASGLALSSRQNNPCALSKPDSVPFALTEACDRYPVSILQVLARFSPFQLNRDAAAPGQLHQAALPFRPLHTQITASSAHSLSVLVAKCDLLGDNSDAICNVCARLGKELSAERGEWSKDLASKGQRRCNLFIEPCNS